MADEKIKHSDRPVVNHEWEAVRATTFERHYREMPFLRGNEEVRELQAWYEERVRLTPPLQRKEVPATNGKEWDYEKDKDGELVALFRPDGTYWEIVGMQYTKPNAKKPDKPTVWIQPVQRMMEAELEVPIDGELRKMSINGIIAVLRDNKGRIAVACMQDTTAETPNQIIIRGIQASAGKMWKMLHPEKEGDENADASLAKLCRILNVKPQELIARADRVTYPQAEDTNLTYKHNIGLEIVIDEDDPAHQALVDDGMFKWLTPTQLEAAIALELTNMHLNGLAAMVKARDYLESLGK